MHILCKKLRVNRRETQQTADMSSNKGKLNILQIQTGHSDVSLVSAVSDTETIRPLLSPIQSDPDQPTAPTTLDGVLSSPDDEGDNLLMKSLKSMSFLNNKYIENANESKTSLRYHDEPNGPDEVAQPFIFNPDNSLVVNSGGNNTSTSLARARSQSITESIVSEIIHLKEFTVAQLKRRRFVVVCIFSVVCIFIFNLIFLPRTSLDRDLRRLYRGFITYDDIARVFINQLYYKPETEKFLEEYSLRKHFTGNGFDYEYTVLNSFPYISTSKEQYDVFMGTPRKVTVTVIDGEHTVYEAEKVAYVPYSANKKVHESFVYVNYGSEDDYAKLKEHKVEFKGSVFVIRVDDVHPSILIKSAQDEGAVGIVLYRDPYDDGKVTLRKGYKAFPDGPARSPVGVESSTGSFIYEQPGDPTTPGWSPYLFDGLERVRDPKTIPQIPVVFVSYADAERILQRIDGTGRQFGWEGDLKFDYGAGPSSADTKLSIVNDVEYGIEPITNIVTKIPGIMSDEEIVIGASGDSSAFAGGVSNSAVTLLEIARGFNELAKRGWKPLRTVKLLLWDGSSAGVLGSTEYGEYREQNLVDNCLMYINLDRISGSKLHVESNPMFKNVTERVMSMILVNGTTPLDSNVTLVGDGVLDYSVFQHYLGIPSINIGYERDSLDPVVYENSEFDNMELLRKFDPCVQLHSIQAQFAGLLALELSEREMIDASVGNYVNVLGSAVRDVIAKIPADWESRNMTYPFQFEKLSDEIGEVMKVANTLDELCVKFEEKVSFLRDEILQDYPWFKIYKKFKTAIAVKRINLKMKAMDKLFVKDSGWFRHLLFTPSGVLLAGMHDAIARGDFESFAEEIVSLRLAMQRVERLL